MKVIVLVLAITFLAGIFADKFVSIKGKEDIITNNKDLHCYRIEDDTCLLENKCHNFECVWNQRFTKEVEESHNRTEITRKVHIKTHEDCLLESEWNTGCSILLEFDGTNFHRFAEQPETYGLWTVVTLFDTHIHIVDGGYSSGVVRKVVTEFVHVNQQKLYATGNGYGAERLMKMLSRTEVTPYGYNGEAFGAGIYLSGICPSTQSPVVTYGNWHTMCTIGSENPYYLSHYFKEEFKMFGTMDNCTGFHDCNDIPEDDVNIPEIDRSFHPTAKYHKYYFESCPAKRDIVAYVLPGGQAHGENGYCYNAVGYDGERICIWDIGFQFFQNRSKFGGYHGNGGTCGAV